MKRGNLKCLAELEVRVCARLCNYHERMYSITARKYTISQVDTHHTPSTYTPLLIHKNSPKKTKA